MAEERRRKRRELLKATEEGLKKLAKAVGRRTKTPMKESEIGLKAGKILERHKVGKHFELTIGDGSFQWARRQAAIEQEAKLDGIYVIRTSEPKERLTVEDTVRRYKSLLQVERAFRTLKGIDLLVRPTRHRTENEGLLIFFSACLLTMSNGTCGALWRPFCSKTKNCHSSDG